MSYRVEALDLSIIQRRNVLHSIDAMENMASQANV